MKTSKKSQSACDLGEKFEQIRPHVKRIKKKALSIGFSHILHGEYLLKQKVVVVQTPEWKFKAIIARNVTFEGRLAPKFCPIWVKNDKKLIIFQNFTLGVR